MPVRVGLKGLSKVIPLLVSSLLGVQVWLKGLVRVKTLPLLFCFGAYTTLCSPFLDFCPRHKES